MIATSKMTYKLSIILSIPPSTTLNLETSVREKFIKLSKLSRMIFLKMLCATLNKLQIMKSSRSFLERLSRQIQTTDSLWAWLVMRYQTNPNLEMEIRQAVQQERKTPKNLKSQSPLNLVRGWKNSFSWRAKRKEVKKRAQKVNSTWVQMAAKPNLSSTTSLLWSKHATLRHRCRCSNQGLSRRRKFKKLLFKNQRYKNLSFTLQALSNKIKRLKHKIMIHQKLHCQ